MIFHMKNRRKKEICFKFLIFVSFFFTIEVVLRLSNPRLFEHQYWVNYPDKYGQMAPDKSFIANLNRRLPYSVQTDDNGFRRDLKVSQKDPNFKILVCGDSLTFGAHLHNSHTYTAILEYLLNENAIKNYKFGVFNTSKPGLTIPDYISYLKEKGLAFKPDLVIVPFFPNDISDLTPEHRRKFSYKAVNIGFLGNVKKQFRRLAIYNIVYSLKSSIQVKKTKKEIKKNKKNVKNKKVSDKIIYDVGSEISKKYYGQYNKYFHEMLDLLKKNNTKVLYVLIPSDKKLDVKLEAPRDFVRKLCIDSATQYVDVFNTFSAVNDPRALFLLPEDRHLSRFGNLLIARDIAKEIFKIAQRDQIW